MFEVYLAALLCVISAIFYLYRIRRRRAPRPPGPRGYPIIGSILDIEPKKTHLSFEALAEQYGEIYSLKMLHHRLVVLNSAESISAACMKEPMATIFSDRPPLFAGQLYSNQNDVVTGRAGSHHYKLRKITHKLLKSYGDGVQRIEGIAVEELRKVVKKFHDTNGHSFDPSQLIHTSVCNTICSLLVGQTFEDNDREIKAIKNGLFATDKLITPGLTLLLTSMPALAHFPPFRKIVRDALRSKEEFVDVFVNQSRENLDSEHLRGIIDELLVNPEVTEDDTEAIALNFMVAGTATTYSAILCTLLSLITHKDVQRRIQLEIDDVIGKEPRSTQHAVHTSNDTRESTIFLSRAIERFSLFN